MEPNKFSSVPTGGVASGNSRISPPDKPGKSLLKEKKLSVRENAAKEASSLPPFYDELHFANYE